jgi:hypothetical protein
MFGGSMAKRLTKALRGKRRWVGVFVNQRYQTRSSLSGLLNSLTQSMEHERPIKLMDFFPSGDDTAVSSLIHISKEGNSPKIAGVAILQVPLKQSQGLRNLLETEKSLDNIGMKSHTTSGKIRLVRERMALPKPERKK